MSNEADNLSETESESPQANAPDPAPPSEAAAVADDNGIDSAPDAAVEESVAEQDAADDGVAEDGVAEQDAADDGVAEDGVAEQFPEDSVAEHIAADEGVADPGPAAEDEVAVEATEVLSVDSSEPDLVELASAETDTAAEDDLVVDDGTADSAVGPDPAEDESPEDQTVSEPIPTEVLAAAPIAGEGATTVLPLPAPVPAPGDPRPAKPKKRSRTVMIAVISVLALLAVLIVGDRIANASAQKSLAESLQQELATPDTPKVSIGGFPFATQALAGSFSSIQVSADDVPVHTDVADLTITHLDAKLTGITVTDRYASIMANRGEATALVDWEEASKLAGQPVTYVADNQMQIDFTIPIGQLSIKGAILGRPVLNPDDQTISVADPKISLSNMDIPQPIADAVSKIALQPFPIRGLPYDIKITALTIQPDGISVSGSGANIPIREQQ